MKKFTFFFALCAMLFINVGFAKAETATISYAGGTTTNMTGNNDATLVGLDASLWSVVSDKGSANNHVGLNKAGNIRLYAHKDSGNGNILTVSISQGTIEKITLDILQEATYEVKVAGNIVAATEETTYSIGATSFSIQNITSGASTQLQLNSITITYSSTGEGGTTPEEPGTDEPETPVGGIEGYSKVTNAASLVAGDKVVLYCDEAEVGVTGWDGNKDATVAASGWVEYVVEVADGGFYLKDGNQYITGAESANHFKYGEKAVCGVSDAGVLACGTKFLYKNSDYYRMYTDKSSNSGYKPFYVYKAGAGSGETPDTPDTPEGSTVEIKGLVYADAYYYEYDGVAYYDIDMYKDIDMDTYEYTYPEVYVSLEAKSKTAINGTYSMVWAGLWTSANDSVLTDEESPVGSVTIKNVDNEGNYSFKGSFVGTDGKTYTFDKVLPVCAFDYDTFEEVTLNENGTDNPGTDNPGNDNPGTSNGTITFDADVDKGNAGTDSNNAAEYTVSKNGVTMTVSSGILGTYNNEMHYRIYKNETLTITSTVGNIVSVEFTCTANDDEKYGPGCFTVADGNYSYSGAVGTWTGSANEVVFTASTNQVRASQIVVKVATSTGVEDVTISESAVKVMHNGQVLIKRGENVYNVVGVQVK